MKSDRNVGISKKFGTNLKPPHFHRFPISKKKKKKKKKKNSSHHPARAHPFHSVLSRLGFEQQPCCFSKPVRYRCSMMTVVTEEAFLVIIYLQFFSPCPLHFYFIHFTILSRLLTGRFSERSAQCLF